MPTYKTPGAVAIRSSPGHPRMGRTRAYSTEDFRKEFKDVTLKLIQSMGRVPSVPDVARELGLHERTVDRYCTRLGCGSPAALINTLALTKDLPPKIDIESLRTLLTDLRDPHPPSGDVLTLYDTVPRLAAALGEDV